RQADSDSLSGREQPLAMIGIIAVAILLPSFLATGPTAAWRHSPVGAGRIPVVRSKNDMLSLLASARNSILWQADGVESSVAIAAAGSGLMFLINGKSDGHVIEDRGTQIMLGLIGTALHPNPRSSLVVGLGTGCTAGWLSEVSTMETVDVVELEPAVIEMARRCALANHDVVGKAESGDKVSIIINDAREVLSTVPKRYDIIASEPSNPYRAGIASLFTREFYRGVRDRLAPGGIFLTWCQSYEIDAATAVTILATLREVFPHVECWYTQPNDLVFVAGMEPVRPDVSVLRRRLQEQPYADALRIAWGTEGLEGFMSHYIARQHFIDELVAANPRGVNTDDLMLVEYDYARSLGKSTQFNQTSLVNASRRRKAVLPEWLPKDTDIGLLLDNYFFSWLFFDTTVPPEAGPPPELVDRLRLTELWRTGDLTGAAALLPATEPKLMLEHLARAEVLAALGDEQAETHIARFEDWWPASAAFARARLAMVRNGTPEAIGELLEKGIASLHRHPWEPVPAVTRGLEMVTLFVGQVPAYRERFFASLSEPLALHLQEMFRKNALLSVAGTMDARREEQVLVSWYEPHPPWSGPLLLLRVGVYRALNNRLMGRAIRDLDEFNENVEPGIEDLIGRAAAP
ncbi:MAG: fused MFS/spermidine synthase, partial [Planctomycetes bacterium]|nr:fused MFS/spermidine synthase [Planctomycetota bacterium]